MNGRCFLSIFEFGRRGIARHGMAVLLAWLLGLGVFIIIIMGNVHDYGEKMGFTD